MAERKRTRRTRRTEADGRSLLSFNEDDFMGFVRKLRRKYPGEWVAIRIISEDSVTGETSGEILAHDRIGGVAFKAAADHHEQHPDDVIEFFCTDLALSTVRPV